jgi:hypothetical protein
MNCSLRKLRPNTWKLNIAKSRYSPGPPPKSEIATFEQVGSNVKMTLDRIDAEGKTVHIERCGQFDGKEYAVNGDANSDMRSYKKIDDYAFAQVNRKGGRITTTVRIDYSRDGKIRSNTVTGTNTQGQKVNNIQVYDRQ